MVSSTSVSLLCLAVASWSLRGAAGAALKGSRAAPPGPCGVAADGAVFKTWMDSVVTSSPVVRPRSDSELADVLSRAAASGCRVRVVGASHTENGMVQQKGEFGVVVVNLSQYVPDDAAWDGVVSAGVAGGEPSIRISAGASFLQLMAAARPQGLVLPTQTAGFFFSVGGVVMNPSVHGGTFGEGRLNALVMSLRVMLWNGTVALVTEPAEVRAWRGSMGLLGVATAVQVRLRRDTGLDMRSTTTTFSGEGGNPAWSQAAFEGYLRDILDRYGSAEWFFNPFSSSVQAQLIDYAAPTSGFNYSATAQAYYAPLLAKYSGANSLSATGGIVTPASAAAGALVGGQGNKLLNEALMAAGLVAMAAQVASNSAHARDGYYLGADSLTKYNQLSAVIRCPTDCVSDHTAWAVLDASRTFLQQDHKTWYPTLPLEWRFLDVGNESTQLLEHLEPGRWMALELTNARDTTAAQVHLPIFLQLEQIWKSVAPSAFSVHLAKAWGMDYAPQLNFSDNPFPFQSRAMLGSVYDAHTRSAFLAKMDQYDPHGLFRAGAALQMLGLDHVMYDPRAWLGDQCAKSEGCAPTSVDQQHDHGCCCTDLRCMLDRGTCTAAHKSALGGACSVDCQCAQGLRCGYFMRCV